MDQTLAQKLAAYKPTEATKELIRITPILLLVGPTGAGKDSVKDELLKTGRFHHIVSHTTRPPRINLGVIEQDGREYHFINQATAQKMLDEHAFIEAKIYSGNLYGTSVAEIQAAHDEGKTAMTDLDVQGVAEYKALDPEAMAVFLVPPDFDIWQDRLQRRYGDVVDLKDYRRRLETALQELDQLLSTDYYVAIVNDELHHSARRIEEYIETGIKPDQAAARQAAEQLVKDIKNYLDQTPGV